MLTKLLHTRYRVDDLEKTAAFYREVLGLEQTRTHESPRGSKLVFFKAPRARRRSRSVLSRQRTGQGAGGSDPPRF